MKPISISISYQDLENVRNALFKLSLCCGNVCHCAGRVSSVLRNLRFYLKKYEIQVRNEKRDFYMVSNKINTVKVLYDSWIMTQSCLASFFASIFWRIERSLNGSNKHIPPTMYVILFLDILLYLCISVRNFLIQNVR